MDDEVVIQLMKHVFAFALIYFSSLFCGLLSGRCPNQCLYLSEERKTDRRQSRHSLCVNLSEVITIASFKFVISDGKKSWQVEKDQRDAPVLGKKIGDVLDGGFLGLEGYELLVTGGSDKDGFPMRKDIEGQLRKRFLITKGIGYSGKKREKKGKYKIKGIRRRKMLRGNTIADDVAQINCKVAKAGGKPLAEIFGSKEKEEVKTESGGEAKTE